MILGENRPFTDIPAALVPIVSQWGLDPLWDTTLPKHRSRIEDFPARVTAEVVPLLESPTTNVHVVGHRVRWDQERGLWYCDIELDPGATYMPFVRLAVVRYQPNALAGAKISKVVLCEFAQVLPRRRATFARTARRSRSAPRHRTGARTHEVAARQRISGHLVHPAARPGGETGRNKVELVLQTRDPALDTDLAWSDLKVLASSLLAPAAAVPGPVVQPVSPVVTTTGRRAAAAPAAIVPERLGRKWN